MYSGITSCKMKIQCNLVGFIKVSNSTTEFSFHLTIFTAQKCYLIESRNQILNICYKNVRKKKCIILPHLVRYFLKPYCSIYFVNEDV